MERVIDKAIVLVCCLAGFAVLPWEPALLAALLCAVAAAALAEVLPARFAMLPGLAFALAALVVPVFAAFLPLAVYDLARASHPVVRACWVLPALAAFARLPHAAALVVLVACAVAFLLSFRTRRAQADQADARCLHDSVREASLALEAKNAQLRERQDLEVRLATLAERGRIAREIYDNVGHLLTRSIMQVEALQVVHRDDDQVRGELVQVGATLHEAMDTVRASVHDLHDDAFDLETQLRAAADACALPVDLELRIDEVPQEVGLGLVAIVREALSNAQRHSNARRVRVSVLEHPGFYRLTVQDDGTRPPAPPEAHGGIGLATMEDRARTLGGVFRTSFDNGFRVFVSVPKRTGEEQA